MRRLGDRMLFVDDIRAILLNPLLHTRETVKAALALFTGGSPFMSSVYNKPCPTLFVDLMLHFHHLDDEAVVECALVAASHSRVKRFCVENHKEFLLSLFH